MTLTLDTLLERARDLKGLEPSIQTGAGLSGQAGINGVTCDSRAVKKGVLFVALPGAKADGRAFIHDAIRHGARVILGPPGTQLPGKEELADLSGEDTVLLTHDTPRAAYAVLAAAFYNAQPQTIAAVTGTNGKTSTVHFAQQIWAHLGAQSASLGTLGVRTSSSSTGGQLTTPDPARLHAELADLAAAGITHLAMEASSHGLDQHRLEGVDATLAGFTNLSRDHLDYHGDMRSYFAAKARLFTQVMDGAGKAVINADDEYGDELCGLCRAAGIAFSTYGFKGADLRLVDVAAVPAGQRISVECDGGAFEATLPLVGEFQVYNALCAAGLVMAGGDWPAQDVLKALEGLEGVPGRLQFVGGHSEGAGIYVDYAHTPAALENVLQALRAHTKGRLICLIGCGGDRDPGKRPLMGAAAVQYADLAFITDDNPRSEDPAAIRAAMLEGAEQAKSGAACEVAERACAIQSAIQQAGEGDIVLIAGKGHEQGQIMADHIAPFDDADQARKAIQSLQSTKTT